MTDQVAAFANTVIFSTYFAISLTIARGLWKSRQWLNNKLGTATAAIFFTCAFGHGLHAVLYFSSAANPSAAQPFHAPHGELNGLGLASAVWDVGTAFVGIWYWSLRGRFPALVRGAAVFEDLRLRQTAERKLRLSEQRYRGIVETTSEGVVLIDATGAIDYANAQFAALVGHTPREVHGMTFTDLVLPQYREPLLAALAMVRDRDTQRIEVELAPAGRPRGDGHGNDGHGNTVHAQIALTARADTDTAPVGTPRAAAPPPRAAAPPLSAKGPASPADGLPVGIPADSFGGALAMVADVTERRNVEAKLRQSQRLDAVGQLAGGVAHDFNNLLTVIDGYAALLLGEVEGPVRRDVIAIRDAAARASALTRQLLAFSRTQPIQPQAVDVNELVNGIEDMLRRLIREDVQIVVRAEAQNAIVWADRGQLEQVLINLAVNSRDAMPDGGQLTISTARVLLAPATPATAGVGIGVNGAAGGLVQHVLLTVSDTGVGIPEEARGLIFEPFFTTKEPGQGTGLGLSTVYGIVRQAGGQVLVDSARGIGTDVRVYLPATSSAPGAATPRRDTAPISGGRGTVLLVEDDGEVRRLSERILLMAGYDVLTAADGPDAIKLAGAAAALDILVTDVMMPRMNGRQLADRLRASRPGLPVLYVSAYHRGMINPTSVAAHGVAYVEKPCSPAVLTEKVGELLAAATAARRVPDLRPAPTGRSTGGS
ncbi:ATP-binding protein [Pseudofrankia sp. BMG5.37]|uniref:hybrid sensor histidine kinase/response regulator n=1 Tax=Pseudofrankia sp. BMG5.37 TaxID=3050035 RepID=UPI002893AE34|nr:ATP-binding protein [Pseudofrankia sp. BMG5.37]MDT3445190.1 ATP-binding protein [Pseudofrankia sp. BMG5.37]